MQRARQPAPVPLGSPPQRHYAPLTAPRASRPAPNGARHGEGSRRLGIRNGWHDGRRRSGATLAALLLLLAAAPTSAQAPDAWPWHAAGRIQRDGTVVCSGVLIAPRQILTAGHCVVDGQQWERLPPQRLQVLLAGATYQVADTRLPATSPFTPTGELGDLRNDWAVLELASEPRVAPIPYAGPAAARRAVAAAAPLFKVGYDQRNRRHRDVACSILDLSPAADAFVFRCPGGTGRGRSGSAILIQQGNGYEVIGIQSAEGRNAFTTIGLGVSP